MSLDMIGHVDNVFLSLVIKRVTKGGSYVNGYWVEDNAPSGSFDANIQPLNDRDIRNLGIGLERVGDVRKLYINNAVDDISLNDHWSFSDISSTALLMYSFFTSPTRSKPMPKLRISLSFNG